LCQYCAKNKIKNCQTCASDCKIFQNGPDWHCGAWRPKPLTEEEMQKVNKAIDDIWDRIEKEA
jgi:hypothetical protein